MNKIEQLAYVSIARGFGFMLLGIGTFMVGLSSDFAVALRAGGYMCLLMCFVLMLMGWGATLKPYNRTELWLLLEPMERPQAAVAQAVISSARREACLTFALHSAWMTAVLLVMAVLWGLAPGRGLL